jgi:hypothetical protein
VIPLLESCLRRDGGTCLVMVVRGRDVNGFMPQCGTVEVVWINQAIRLIFEHFIEIADVLMSSLVGWSRDRAYDLS